MERNRRKCEGWDMTKMTKVACLYRKQLKRADVQQNMESIQHIEYRFLLNNIIISLDIHKRQYYLFHYGK